MYPYNLGILWILTNCNGEAAHIEISTKASEFESKYLQLQAEEDWDWFKRISGWMGHVAVLFPLWKCLACICFESLVHGTCLVFVLLNFVELLVTWMNGNF